MNYNCYEKGFYLIKIVKTFILYMNLVSFLILKKTNNKILSVMFNKTG